LFAALPVAAYDVLKPVRIRTVMAHITAERAQNAMLFAPDFARR
jgi:hypothetical protein